MFLSSYSPLMVILAARDLNYTTFQFDNPTVVWACLGAALLSCIAIFLLIRSLTMGDSATVTSVDDRSIELLNYTIPYLISFLSLDIGEASELVSFSLFMMLMFWLTYKTDNLYINPVLTLMNYKLYRVTVTFSGSEPVEINALTKDTIKPGSQIFLEKVASFMYIQTTRNGS